MSSGKGKFKIIVKPTERTFTSSVPTTTIGIVPSATKRHSYNIAKVIILLAFALGPIIWLAVSIWIVVRQVTGSRLRLGNIALAFSSQILLISLPFFHYSLSLREAGPAEFTSCPNNQEYCDKFWEIAALKERFFFFLGTAF